MRRRPTHNLDLRLCTVSRPTGQEIVISLLDRHLQPFSQKKEESMRFISRLRIPTLVVVVLCAAVLAFPASSLLAQTCQAGLSAPPSSQGLTGSFNGTTRPFKYLFTNGPLWVGSTDRKSTRLNSSHLVISY